MLNGTWLLNSLAPDDEMDGTWPRERLLEMDARFSTALELAFLRELERRESACAEFLGAVKGSTVVARWRAWLLGQLLYAAPLGTH